MAIFISVVSHGHGSLIKKLACLSLLSEKFEIVVKSNVRGDQLSPLCKSNNFHWIDSEYGLGFGHNNNFVFDYCQKKLGMKGDDYFIVLNPDVVISQNDLSAVVSSMISDKVKIGAINLYRDKDFNLPDNSIRKFPTMADFIKSFLGLGNSSVINKSLLSQACDIDWAAGSFLAFETSHFSELSGFDESYFMYCEDIDICYRSKILHAAVRYYPEIRAQHLAKHNNRKIWSMHFLWHVSSVIRFMLVKHNLVKSKSSIIS